MKKIFSLIILFAALFTLSACGDDLGEFPEVKENKKVEMTADEVNTMLSSVDMEEQMKEAMMFSIDLELMVENTNSYYDWESDEYIEESTIKVDGTMSSKTYVYLNEQIDEVALIMNNEIDMNYNEDYVDAQMEDDTQSAKGSLDVYFTNQFLYYNNDLTLTDVEEEDMIENGKFKASLGITQAMWDQIYTIDSNGLVDQNLINTNLEGLMEMDEAMEFMVDSGMLSVYKSGSEYTVVMTVSKAKILENINALIDMMMDTTGFTEADYSEYKIELEEQLDMFEKLEMSVAYVIEDNVIQKIAIRMDIKLDDEDMKLELSGKIVLDFKVDLPSFPKDLDEYKLTDAFSNGFMQ